MGTVRQRAGFYRYAGTHLRAYFPTLPHRGQFNRLLRRHRDAVTRFGLFLGQQAARRPAYEALDCTAAVVRHAKRRGRGWLAGRADVGWSNRLGWYCGFHVLTAATPCGAITGFGAGPASANDRLLAETFFALRAAPDPRLPSAGTPPARHGGYAYLADSGFAGHEWEPRWQAAYGARVVCAPQRGSRRHRAWPKPLRRWLASLRQIVETVHDRLLHAFRLDRERPHALSGFLARLGAKVALHNFCLTLNQRLGRPPLAVADLIDWP